MGKRFLILVSILAVTLFTSYFAFSVPETVSAHGDWQTIAPGSVSIKSKGPKTTELSLKTVVPLPASEKSIFAGFGWLYADGTSAYVAATHNGVKDSTQRPNGWHQHNVVVAPSSSGSTSHCIISIDDDSHGGTAINKDTLRVITQNTSFDGTFMSPPTAISFDIIPDPTCPLGVGIGVHQIEPAPPVEEGEE